MKLSRIIIFIVVVAIGIQGYLFFTKKPSTVTPETPQVSQEVITQTQAEIPTVAVATQRVTVNEISKKNVAYLDLTGTVKAMEQTKVYPVTAAQVSEVYVQEGDVVKKGDVLMTFAGMNGNKTAADVQLQIAQASYKAAVKSYQNTIDANDSGLRSAKLQLDSAMNQAQGSYIDVKVLQRTLNGARQGLSLLQDTLETSQHKNEQDLENAQEGIEDLQDTLDNLQEERSVLLADLSNKISSTMDPVALGALQQEFEATKAGFDANISALSTQLDAAKNGYDTLKDVVVLSENQVVGQIQQAETQGDVVYLNQQGLQRKLGLYDGSSDPARMAEEAVNTVIVRNNAALSGAQLQRDLAKLNLELAQIQADGLTVTAPFDGIIAEVYAHNGDQISPQVPVVQVTSKKDFELKVGVSPENASKIMLNAMAQIEIGGHYLKVPVKSIAPVADATTKLVNVTVALPKIFFRANQTRKVRLPLQVNSNTISEHSFFIPLDAIIIGTQEQYVFVYTDGKAVKHTVKLGVIQGDQAQIIGGLNESDKVIVDGAKELVDGQEVHI